MGTVVVATLCYIIHSPRQELTGLKGGMDECLPEKAGMEL